VEFIKGTLGKLSVPLFIPHKTTDTIVVQRVYRGGGRNAPARKKQTIAKLIYTWGYVIVVPWLLMGMAIVPSEC